MFNFIQAANLYWILSLRVVFKKKKSNCLSTYWCAYLYYGTAFANGRSPLNKLELEVVVAKCFLFYFLILPLHKLRSQVCEQKSLGMAVILHPSKLIMHIIFKTLMLQKLLNSRLFYHKNQ